MQTMIIFQGKITHRSKEDNSLFEEIARHNALLPEAQQAEISFKLPDHCRPFDKKIQVDRNVHIDPDELGSGNLFNQ